jgi:hypothetical protein
MTELSYKTERQQQQNQSPATPLTIANTSSSNVSQTPTNSRYTSEASGNTYDFLGIDSLLSIPRDSTSMKLSDFNAISGRDQMELSTPNKTRFGENLFVVYTPINLKLLLIYPLDWNHWLL